MKILAVAVIGLLAFSCLLSFSLGQVDRYKMSIVEKGTSYSEQIEVDEKQEVEVFRVPAHNDVDAADFYHDFKMRVTVTKVPSRMACYIAKMDPSVPSPGKLKADLDRSASQSSQLPVITQEHTAVVTGLADRRELTKEILDFCGALPIYETDVFENSTLDETGSITLIQNPARRLRRQQKSFQTFKSCLQSMSASTTVDELKYVKDRGCDKRPDTWQLQCRFKRLNRNCHFFATCKLTGVLPGGGRDHVWVCKSVHLVGDSLYSYCCDPVCPPSTGRK